MRILHDSISKTCILLVESNGKLHAYNGLVSQVNSEYSCGKDITEMTVSNISRRPSKDKEYPKMHIQGSMATSLTREELIQVVNDALNKKQNKEIKEEDNMSCRIKKQINVTIEDFESEVEKIDEIKYIKIILDNDKVKEWINNYGILTFHYKDDDGILSVLISDVTIEFKPMALVISNGEDVCIPLDLIKNIEITYYK